MISKVESVTILSRLYVLLSRKDHFKINKLLTKYLREQLLLECTSKELSATNVSIYVELLRFLAKNSELTADEKKIGELALRMLSRRKKELDYLQRIKICFAYF